MKILSFEKKKQKFIDNKLSYPEAVNEQVFNAIASGKYEGFLPIDIIKKRKYITLKCQVTELTPLNIYFTGAVSKKIFLSIVQQLVKIILCCSENRINPNNLDLQPDRIFIDPGSAELSCIYWPIVNNHNAVPPHLFLKQLPYDVIFYEDEDKEFVDKYFNFFESSEPFSIIDFEKLINSLSGKEISTSYAPSKTQEKTLESNTKDTEAVIRSIEYDPFAQLAVSNDTDEEDPRNVFKSRKTYDNLSGTIALGDEMEETLSFPYLIRISTDEKILLDRFPFRIGKSMNGCDYAVADNKAVSRNHADIILRDDQFYIIDLNSTNKTYVNGHVIPSEKEIEISSKTKLRLANEEFMFYVEQTVYENGDIR